MPVAVAGVVDHLPAEALRALESAVAAVGALVGADRVRVPLVAEVVGELAGDAFQSADQRALRRVLGRGDPAHVPTPHPDVVLAPLAAPPEVPGVSPQPGGG